MTFRTPPWARGLIAEGIGIVPTQGTQTPPSSEPFAPEVFTDPIEERLTAIRRAVVVRRSNNPHPNVSYGQGKWLLENPDQQWPGDLSHYGNGVPGPYNDRERICIGLMLLSLADIPESNALLAKFHEMHATDHALISLLTDDEWHKAGIDTHRDDSQSMAPHRILSGCYIDNLDGTVTDTSTGLMWMRCALGQTWDGVTCSGEAQSYHWDEVITIRHNFAGYDNWRLPDIDELKSLIDPRRKDLSIFTTAFPNTSEGNFWSTSVLSNGAHYVTLFNGAVYDFFHSPHDRMGKLCNVWLVRTGTLQRNIEEPDLLPSSVQELEAVHSNGAVLEVKPGVFEVAQINGENPTTLLAENAPHTNSPPGALVMDESKAVTESFTSSFNAVVLDMDIGIAFESAENVAMKNGESAFILYVTITNRLKKQVRVEPPLSSYVTAQGEEIGQDGWLSGLLNGGKGALIRGGAFKKAGVIFFQQKLKGILQGDRLYISVVSPSSFRQFNFSFLCTDQTKRTFTLVEASAEDATKDEVTPAQQPTVQAIPAGSDALGIIERLESMESRFLHSLDRMESVFEAQAATRTTVRTAIDLIRQFPESFAAEIGELRSLLGDTGQGSIMALDSSRPTLQPVYASLPLLLHSLIELQTISVADIRKHLLPLDLLPSTVIEDINEKAFDLVGEPALEEDGDQIIVFRDVLAQVLENWDTPGMSH